MVKTQMVTGVRTVYETYVEHEDPGSSVKEEIILVLWIE